MSGGDRPADRIRKLVALAASGDTAEARSAAAMARRQLAALEAERERRRAARREAKRR